MKRFLIEVSTNWCGEDNTYSAYANTESELDNIADNLAYENFSDFGGFDAVLQDMFPEVEDGEYTDEMIDQAAQEESGYYSYFITEWDEERPEEEWEWYSLIYDGRLVEDNDA